MASTRSHSAPLSLRNPMVNLGAHRSEQPRGSRNEPANLPKANESEHGPGKQEGQLPWSKQSRRPTAHFRASDSQRRSDTRVSENAKEAFRHGNKDRPKCEPSGPTPGRISQPARHDRIGRAGGPTSSGLRDPRPALWARGRAGCKYRSTGRGRENRLNRCGRHPRRLRGRRR